MKPQGNKGTIRKIRKGKDTKKTNMEELRLFFIVNKN